MQLEISIFVEERQILKIQKELMPNYFNRDVLLNVFLQDDQHKELHKIIPHSVKLRVLSSCKSLKIRPRMGGGEVLIFAEFHCLVAQFVGS